MILREVKVGTRRNMVRNKTVGQDLGTRCTEKKIQE